MPVHPLPPASRQGQPEAERLASRLVRMATGSRLFGVTLLGDSLIFWFILLAFQFLGYGGRPGGTNGPTWYLLLTFAMAYLAMAAGETRFQLHRRVWTVAGINDAFA